MVFDTLPPKIQIMKVRPNLLMVASVLVCFFGSASFAEANPAALPKLKEAALEQFEDHCFKCHDEEAKKGDLDLANLPEKAILTAL